MSKTQKVLIRIALVLVVAVLGLSVSNAYWDQQLIRSIQERCWAQGGDYRDGTCKLPEYMTAPEGKVCETMNGNLVVTEDKTTGKRDYKCYSYEGKELKLPNLEGKEVIEVFDGTVVLRDKRK